MNDQQNARKRAFDAVAKPDLTVGLSTMAQYTALNGLEILKLVLSGALPAPPIAKTMSLWLSEASHGLAEFRGVPEAAFLNPMGIVHGGWTMTFLDSALGCAVQTVLDAGEGYVSLGTEVKFIRPVMADSGQLRAIGKIVSRGRQTATAEARVEDQSGRVLATGTTTCFLRLVAGST